MGSWWVHGPWLIFLVVVFRKCMKWPVVMLQALHNVYSALFETRHFTAGSIKMKAIIFSVLFVNRVNSFAH